MTCTNCGNDTTNPKFCSKSCAAIYNGSRFPKRKLEIRNCKKCGKEIERQTWKDQSTSCKSCNPRFTNWTKVTLADLEASRYKHARIRDVSRKAFIASGRAMKCIVCSYTNHVDVAHVKPVSEFSKDTSISDVNSLDNLVALCRNHHWELDHGKMSAANRRKVMKDIAKPF